MKKLIIFISSIILTVFSVPTFANLEGVAVIDYQAIFLGTDLARTSLDELRESEDYKELMEEVQLKDSERLAIAEELNKDSSTMSDEEQSEKLKKAQSLYQDIQFLAQKMQTLENEVVQKLQANQGADVHKITLLFNSQALLAYDRTNPLINITPEVIELLNQANSKE